MPPKPATVCWPPRRTPRTTARKSIPPHSSTAFATPPSSTTSPEPYEKSSPINAPNTTITLDTTTAPASPIPEKVRVKKTIATNSGLVKCSKSGVHNKVVKSVPTENVETDNLMESGNDANTEQHEKNETSIGPESRAGDVAGAGKGTRKVIRRTVRVVKRVIKTRVPKTELLSNGSENRDFVDDTDNVGKLVTDSDVIENPISMGDKLADPAKDVIEKPNLVIQDEEINGTSQLSNGAGVSEPMVDGRGNDPSGFEDMEKRTSEVIVGSHGLEQVVGYEKRDEVDMKGIDTSFPDSVEDKEVQFVAKSTLESERIERVEKPIPMEDVIVKPKLVTENLNIQDDLMETSEISSGVGVSEPMVGEKGDDQSPIMTVDEKNDNVMDEADRNDINMSFPDSVEDKDDVLGGSVMENQNMDAIDKKDLGLIAAQTLGPVEEEKYVVLVEEKDGSLGKHESGNGLEDGSQGLFLSNEMEALERRKRRKTEIFIGGLEKDVKEDDIRKAFEEAGTIMDVDLVMNSRKTGKNKGFAFVRFSSVAEANNALTKYSKVEICGKQSSVQPVQGNDTIFLGNIDRNWKTEDVMQLLEKAGADNIDKVLVKADPNKIERNRGFAFVEFETTRAAQSAFYKLQNKNVFGKNVKVRVAWAQPLIEPAEEEILKVKSVYAEYLPSSWNEEKVKEYFKRFGEIENVAHAKDLTSSRRNDFAFINYKTREAARACIEAVRKERLLEDDGSKVKMTVSLAKPISMRKQMKHDTSATMKQLSKDTSKVSTAAVKLHEPRNNGKYASSSYNHGRVSTTDELMHILRRQASTNHIPPRDIIGPFMPDNHLPLPGGKRPFPFVGHDPLYMESRGLPRARFEYSNPIPGLSYLPHGREMEPFPYHHQPEHGFTSESVRGRKVYPSHFPTRERSPPPYYGNSNIFRQY